MSLARRRLALVALRARAVFGWPGALALLLLVVAAGVVLWTPLLAGEADVLRIQAETESQHARVRLRDQPADPSTQMAQFREWFPQRERALEDLRTIYRVAKKHQVQLPRGDYAPGRQADARLGTYDIVLPVRAGYPGIRAFVAAVLNELPHASLADLRMERVQGEAIDARVHLTLFYRED